MDCEEARSYFPDSPGRADGVPNEEARRHVEECSRCGNLLKSLKIGDAALTDAIPFLAPEGGYLTDERMKRLLESAQSAESAGSRVIALRARKRRYWAVAAAVMLVAAGFLIFQSYRGPDHEPHAGDAIAAAGPRTVEYHVVSEFDDMIDTTADLWETPGFELDMSVKAPEGLLATSSRGLTVPVHETERIRHDNYWW